jgi:2,3,4,5-tetrahydropyridine-2,6-dicarboxylate N-succinyltransferase
VDRDELRRRIESTFQDRALLAKDAQNEAAVREAVALLDRGEARIAEKVDGDWKVNDWLKKAVLLFFAVQKMELIEVGPYQYHDKIPLKRDLDKQGIRVVPPGTVRYGAHVERGAVIMPGYVNIGGYVGAGTMVDTWATVGSCAQVGKNVHLSGGVGLGGVLEPPSARPVIVEDGCFIGSRCIVVEGAVIEERAVLGANVTITASTKIIDVTGKEPVYYKGRVPAGSVVIPGSIPKEFPAGTYNVPCALIIGKRSRTTDEKTSLNEALRDFAVDV